MEKISRSLAEDFISRVRQRTEYNINIMNKDGIIIASKDPERIGQFHEQAYRIVQSDYDEYIVEEKDVSRYMGGVRAGITRPIIVSGEIIGAIGMTGDPEKLKEACRIMQFSIETMYEYERQRKLKTKANTIRDHFISMLLYEPKPDLREIRSIAKDMGWDEKVPRIAILITMDIMADLPTVLRKLRENPLFTKQDILAPVQNRNVFVFKSMKSLTEFAGYKDMIRAFTADACDYLRTIDSSWHLYAGSFQTGFSGYQASYAHCRWLRKHTNQEYNFFYDYTQEYLLSRIDHQDLSDVYRTFLIVIKENGLNQFETIMSALKACDYNLNTASRALFLHKNTLVYQFNKIRQALNIDPIHSQADRSW
ncbi:MAG: helix-turn-helix domain-containing protein [Lachnospiraceae bacterium]|nr:helix-turn-helix domain-containing protein [Lachnospiraceae bacterium]